MCFRALEMLQNINQLPTRRTRFSRTAMITLLNFNLPVKFGLMGHLAATDKISDGFHDVGKVCALRLIKTKIHNALETYFSFMSIRSKEWIRF